MDHPRGAIATTPSLTVRALTAVPSGAPLGGGPVLRRADERIHGAPHPARGGDPRRGPGHADEVAISSKVLHELGGRPMLAWPARRGRGAAARALVVVIGRDAGRVAAAFDGRRDLRRPGGATRHRSRGAAGASPRSRGHPGDVLDPLRRHAAAARRDPRAPARDEGRDRGGPRDALVAGARCPGSSCADADGRVQRIVEMTDATPEELRIRRATPGSIWSTPSSSGRRSRSSTTRTRRASSTSPTWSAIAVRDGRRVEALAPRRRRRGARREHARRAGARHRGAAPPHRRAPDGAGRDVRRPAERLARRGRRDRARHGDRAAVRDHRARRASASAAT